MKPLNNRDCLELWEQGAALHPLDRGLLALGAALHGTSDTLLADWPMGRCNAALLELRCASFGPQLRAWTACTQCKERLEFALDGRELTPSNAVGDRERAEPIVLNGQRYRLPTVRDLARAAQESDPGSAAALLVEACRVSGELTQPCASADIEELERQMALADPLAEIVIDLECPACGHENHSPLDIASFLWTEIAARAKRLLRDVHVLAAAYGWTEHAVLALSDQRRAFYLELVQI
jgi:hypothetical protein